MQQQLVDCCLQAADRAGGNPSWPGFGHKIVQQQGVQQQGVLQQLLGRCPQASGCTVVDGLGQHQGTLPRS